MRGSSVSILTRPVQFQQDRPSLVDGHQPGYYIYALLRVLSTRDELDKALGELAQRLLATQTIRTERTYSRYGSS